MNECIDVKLSIDKITPEIMAKIFWNMDDRQQADFFEALHEEVSLSYEKHKGKYYANPTGDMQWLALRDELRKRRKAGSLEGEEMYMALSAFAFELFPRKMEL